VSQRPGFITAELTDKYEKWSSVWCPWEGVYGSFTLTRTLMSDEKNRNKRKRIPKPGIWVKYLWWKEKIALLVP
jgi:hypothetical protein